MTKFILSKVSLVVAVFCLLQQQVTFISALTPEEEANRAKLVQIRNPDGNQRAVKDYWFGPYLVDWYEAQTLCADSGLKFITIESPIEQEIVNQFLAIGDGTGGWTGTAWIGARDTGSVGTFYWSPRAGARDKMYHTNWAFQPTTSGCVVMTNQPAAMGQWFVIPCDTPRYFYCESN